MGSYQKADGITLSQLNNTEYTNFMNRVLALLTTGSISKLTVTNIVNSIKPRLAQMEDLVNRSMANAETKDLLKLDAERDSYVSYLLATVRAAKNSPLAAQRDAYNTLEITVRPYTGLARMRNMEETAAITGLLLDFRKEAVKAAVTALETANKNYSALTDARSATRTAESTADSKTVRAQLDSLYDDLVMHVTAVNILTPSITEASAFLTALNQVITETKAAYDRRKGITAPSKPSGGGEAPDPDGGGGVTPPSGGGGSGEAPDPAA